ncbi:MAG: twin-arginine translocase subunit TatC [Actinomycetota bacterium]|nr:twin-arginine translocase subunit TatC [Actinomycetota bacterium]
MTSASMPLMSHLEEFRSRLIKAAVAVALGTVIAFIFNEQILDLLAKPYQIAVPDGELAFFRPTEAFATVMRLSLFGGVILASPVILYQAWRFVAPALSPKEKRWAYPITAVFAFLFLVGVLIGYFALERGLGFLLEFGGDALTPIIGADFYLKFATRFILAFGLAFEFPVFLFAAAAAGAVSSKKLRSNRRWAVLIILIAAAFITPSGDPMTLMLLSVPLYLLYELTILAIRFVLRK